MTKRKLFLELLENKKKVKNDKLFEFHSSPEDEETIVVNSFIPYEKQEEIPEESLLQDLLQSEDLNLNNLNRQEKIEEERVVPSPPKIQEPLSKKTSPVFKRTQSSGYESSEPVEFKKATIKTSTPLNDDIKKSEILIKKQQLLIKFDILRKNSQRYIPIYTMNHNYSVMKHHYKLLVKQLHIDNKITFYKQCLLGFSGYLEIFLGEAFMGLDMKGYTEFQANNMYQYDKILLKIGEKSYMPQTMSSMPVEMQLLMSVGIQTAIFVGSKMISNKTGLNISSLFKMQGDSVNLEMPKS